MCLSEYEDRVDAELPEVVTVVVPEVPILEHVVNVEPPPAVTFHIESAEQLQPVQNGERITIVVD